MPGFRWVTAMTALVGFLLSATVGLAQWSVETVQEFGRKLTRVVLPEFGGRATLVIRCTKQGADPIVYLRQALSGTHVNLTYRFDDDEAQTRMVPLSESGHVLQIWSDDEREAFSRSKRLRVQPRPLLVLINLRSIETVAAKLRCR